MSAKVAPDLVLMDTMLSAEMTGLQTADSLQQSHPVPVVFMTARVQSREIDHFKSLGAAGVLAKPFDPGTLAESVCRFLKTKPSELQVMNDGLHERLGEYATELRACLATLKGGGDREDELVHVRHIAHRLAGSGGNFGHGPMSADAMSLEKLLIAEAAEADVHSAIETLLASLADSIGRRSEQPPVPPVQLRFADGSRSNV